MSTQSDPSFWEKKESELVADCRIFKVFKSRFRHPVRQTEGDFFAIDAADWITVVAITENQELVAVRQFRFGIEDLSLEVPAGLMEAGEDPLATGLRELREETGYEGENAELLGWVYPNPAIQTNRCFVIAVNNARKIASTEWDEHEEIQTQLIPLGEMSQRIQNGEFRHSLSVCAWSYYCMK
ncbi:MAG: NUDIX hydrolase [Opitutales bacterium]|nr:NUDIX hydrolase [Opitutales bacterium]